MRGSHSSKKGVSLKFDPEKARATYNANIGLTLAKLEQRVGGLSKPSKMPWYSYSIPAEHCKVGSQLRKVKGSVCASCYARKGRYKFPNVADAMEKRYQILLADVSAWAGNMAALISKRSGGGKHQYFRWHDSGDLHGQAHLDAIIWIAKLLPYMRFWLPTKEYSLVRANVSNITNAPNLTVRVSAPKVNQVLKHELPTSSVGANEGYRCMAYSHPGNKCGSCRACWDKEVNNVDYRLH